MHTGTCKICGKVDIFINDKGECGCCLLLIESSIDEAMRGQAAKHDTGKVPLSLLPYAAILEEAKVFNFGAKKYSRWNYLNGFETSRLMDACMRHLFAWHWGEDIDPESGLSHLAHARCCLGMLMQNLADGTATDDRPRKFFAKEASK